MKILYTTLALCAFINIDCQAQLTIGNNSVVKGQGTFTTNGLVKNNSNNVDFSNAHLILSGNDQDATTSQPITLSTLSIEEGGIKTLNGNWVVTGSLQLLDGVLRVNDNAKLTFTGQDISDGSETSYVEGFLFQQGTGRKYFPVGAGGTFAPLVIEDVPQQTSEVGARLVNSTPSFVLPLQTTLITPHYWELTSPVASAVSLSLSRADVVEGNELVMLESDVIAGNAAPLEATTGNNFITSSVQITQPLLAIGQQGEFKIVIHDMITPFVLDEINDQLFIENIDLTTSNEVKLFDRWGSLIHTWTDFNNQSNYDFSRLTPGNYVCVVEYVVGSSRSNAKGMITILKTK